MSIFEDLVEVHHNACCDHDVNTHEGSIHVDTLIEVEQKIQESNQYAWLEDAIWVIDYQSAREMVADIDEPFAANHDRPEHVNMNADIIGQLLPRMVCLKDSATQFALLIDGSGVNYDNEIKNPKSVYAVEFVEVDL